MRPEPIEQAAAPEYPTASKRSSVRSLSIWLWRGIILLLLVIFAGAAWWTIQARSLQTFVSDPHPKSGVRFSFRLSKRWQAQPAPTGIPIVDEQGNVRFQLKPPGRLEAWINRIMHPKGTASTSRNELQLDVRPSDLRPFIYEQDGTPYFRSPGGITIQTQRPLIVGGCKASYIAFSEQSGGLLGQGLIIKVTDKPEYIAIGGDCDEAHTEALRNDLDTIARTFKIERTKR